jgi:hypothetical protein
MPRKVDPSVVSLVLASSLAVLSIAGCGRSRSGDSTAPQWDSNPDLDGDSFHAGADCDDGNDAVHPGADEVCDGIDNNCDGTIDVDAVDMTIAWYDSDEDGFGRNPPESWCDVPGGYASRGDDCDDARADVNPDAPEVCDPKNVDEDCDLLADDEDASAGNLRAFYVDVDGDGYGVDDTTPIVGCDTPAGYAVLPGDCDDTSPNASPATIEVCGDIVDDDCDGSVSCALHGDVSVGQADLTLTGAIGGGIAAGDVDGNGVGDLLVDASSEIGMLLFLGPLTTATSESAVANIEASPDGTILDALAMGDQDGDGFDDAAFLAMDYDSPAGSGAGRSYLLLGPMTGSLDAELTADATITGDPGDYLGAAGSAGDVDGDGIVDALLGAFHIGVSAYLFLGPVTGGDRDKSDAVAWFQGSNSGVGWPATVCANGDLDGDGVDDVLVAAPGEDKGAGAGWVFFAPVLGEHEFADADVAISRDGTTEHLGWTTTTSGDLDGDGREDVAIGVYASGGLSRLFVLSGATVTASSEIDATAADAVIEPDPATYGGGAQFGYGTESGGDVDGDGIDDLVVTDYGTTAGGNVWGFVGPLSGTLTASSDAAFVLFPSGPKDYFGYDATLVPDVTGDGFDDLVTSAAPALYGVVYVFATGP